MVLAGGAAIGGIEHPRAALPRDGPQAELVGPGVSGRRCAGFPGAICCKLVICARKATPSRAGQRGTVGVACSEQSVFKVGVAVSGMP